jgi:hypothetical protein
MDLDTLLQLDDLSGLLWEALQWVSAGLALVLLVAALLAAVLAPRVRS